MRAPSAPLHDSRAARLAGEIADGQVRRLFARFVETMSGLHEDIRSEGTDVELRFLYHDQLLCRLVPYRELFHVQVGESPAWETRVRTLEAYADTVDRALQRFLSVHVARATR